MGRYRIWYDGHFDDEEYTNLKKAKKMARIYDANEVYVADVDSGETHWIRKPR